MDIWNTGKNLFSQGKKWLETAGDMNSASDNPQEKIDWIDEQQKQIEQEQKALRPKTGLTGLQQNTRQSRQQVDPLAPAIPDVMPAPIPESVDNAPVYDWTGHPVSEKERQRILANKAQECANNSDDVNDVLDRMKKLREERDAPNKMAFRFDSDIQERQQTYSEKSAFEQAAEATIPQDESLTLFFDHLNENGKDILGENSIWWKNPPGQPDLSYKPATDAAAKNMTDNLGENSAVSGYGRAPAGEPDLSYGPAIGDVTENFGSKSAVTGEGKYVIGAPNMSYWNWENEQNRHIPLDITSHGTQLGMKDLQTLFYSGAGVVGESLFNLVGGDDTSLRRVQGILDLHQKERERMGRLDANKIYVEGDPEKTMQNVTHYLFQELGNQTVKLPAYVIANHLNTFAMAFGVSTAMLSARFYGDFRQKTGDGHAAESVMYAVPLALLSASLIPFKDSAAFQTVREMKDYVDSMVLGVAVHKAQEEVQQKVVGGQSKEPRRDF